VKANILDEPHTILELRALFPTLFHPTQDWYNEEAFARLASSVPIATPTGLTERGKEFVSLSGWPVLPHAVDLVVAYLHYPGAGVWRDYLWTSDEDAYGQRVYIGGTSNGRGLELHRHLRITNRWGVPWW